jgi:hypothetical protein
MTAGGKMSTIFFGIPYTVDCMPGYMTSGFYLFFSGKVNQADIWGEEEEDF